jgi:uncharacterized protein (DUF924 family)
MSPDTATRSPKTPYICERLNMDKRWMSGVLIVAHARNPNSPGPLCVTKINAPSKGGRRNAATLFKPTCICTLPTTHKNKRSSMRTTSLFRSGLACQLSFSRAFATMPTPQPPASFALDKNIFNDTLYSRVRTFWFADLPPDFSGANSASLKRWWGQGATKAERQQVDTFCRDEFMPALQAIAPENLLLPPFESYKAEVESASAIASPLLAQVEAANRHSAQRAADTLISMVILLDQVPRNSFRTQATLPLVYNHYDRLAHALLRSCMKLEPDPLRFPAYMKRPALQAWLYMPLVHSEDLGSHELWYSLIAQVEAEVPVSDTGAREYLERTRKAEDSHIDAVRKFGRYPHRNACLGRESTPEEREWLKTGDTFGVSQGKDEL